MWMKPVFEIELNKAAMDLFIRMLSTGLSKAARKFPKIVDAITAST